MLFQTWSGVEELDVPRLSLVPVDSVNYFLDLQTMGEVLESGEYCRNFFWSALQRVWHFKTCQDHLPVKGNLFVTFLLHYRLFRIIIPDVAALGLSMLCLKSVQSLRNRVVCILNSVNVCFLLLCFLPATEHIQNLAAHGMIL